MIGSCLLTQGSLLPCGMLSSPKENFSNCPRNLYEVLLLSSHALVCKPCTCNIIITAGKRVKFLPNLSSFLGICTMQERYISLSLLPSLFSFLFSIATCCCKKACLFLALPIILLCTHHSQTTICTLSNQMGVCLGNNEIMCMLSEKQCIEIEWFKIFTT